LAIVNLALK